MITKFRTLLAATVLVAAGAAPAAADPLEVWLCPQLAAISGHYGPVYIAPDGDVYVNGDLVYDCPPYEIWPAA